MYSTYEFSDFEKAQLAKQVGAEELDSIIKYHTEDAWPEGINDLNERTGNPDKMKAYKAVQVAKLDDKSILKIIPKKNKHLSAEMVGNYDFYFIINETG